MTREIELFSVEAERALIGALLLDPDAIDRVSDLAEADFYLDECRRIFGAVRRVAAAGKAVDIVTVDDEMKDAGDSEAVGGISTLADLANDCISPSAARFHAEIIRDRGVQRKIMAAAGDVQDAVLQRGMTTAEKLDFAQSAFASLSDGARTKAEPEALLEVLNRHCELLDRRVDGIDAGTSTGFHDLDKRLSGGMREGQMILIAARPGMGKTALALQIAAHVASTGTPALFCSQEMAHADLADRLLALHARIPVEKIITASLDEDDWERISASIGCIREIPLYLDEQPALTLMDVRNKARQVKRKAGALGLLVVDYLQLMTGNGANRNAEIEEISRGLKRLAKEMRMPVIALSQLNRSVESRPNKRPMLSDLRDSGAIEQDADVVMSVYRDETYNPDSPYVGCAELGMLKVRQGKAGGFVPLTYIGQHVRFESFAGTWERAPQPKVKRRDFDD